MCVELSLVFSVINVIYVVGFGIMPAPALTAIGEGKARAPFFLLGTSSVDDLKQVYHLTSQYELPLESK